LAMLLFVRNAEANSPRVVDLKTPDGTVLKGTYFPCGEARARRVVVSSKQSHAQIVGRYRASACCRWN